ncbi:MAG: hypothetical protein RMM29_03585 [Planctomycetota bacterium]|nr:hypothetical protein [Planctomycetota bacterium]
MTEHPAPPPADDLSAAAPRRDDAARTVATALCAPAAAAGAGAPQQAWMAACVCAALAVLVISVAAAVSQPRGQPVTRIEVLWLAGPQAPQREVEGWLASFAERELLQEANEWVIGRLAEHLRSRPGVATVGRIRLAHERSYHSGQLRAARKLIVEIGMRQPYMPAVLASGKRVWVDREGVLLPGSLPAPERRRPPLWNVELAPQRVRAAVEAWQLIEPHVDAGLIAAIDCAGSSDERGGQGIVLLTSNGCRLVWGDPGDALYGRSAQAKARDLVHALRCQGDLARVASVNVRFPRPFYTLR